MPTVSFNEKGYLVDPEGNPFYIVGINYVPSYAFTNMWERWTPEIIENDCKTMSDWGLNAIRVMLFWRYNEPQQGIYNPVFFDQFDTLLKYSKKYDLYVVPCFLCHYSEGDCEIPWRNERPFWSGEMLDIAANHLKYFVKRYKTEEQILFWDIFDEPEFSSRNKHGAEQLPYDRNVLANWVKAMYNAIKSVDPNHLVTLGFGAIPTCNYGMHVKDMAEILDFMSVTAYPYPDLSTLRPGPTCEAVDTLRNNYFISYYVRFQALFGKPVFTCEAPGYSTILYSDDIIAKYYKVTLYSNLINGSNGIMPWTYSDIEENMWFKWALDEWVLEPYFGVKGLDGKLKPQGVELCKFAKFIKGIDITKYSWSNAEIAILVPEGYYSPSMVDAVKLYGAFIFARSSGGVVDFVWDEQDITKYRLLIIPSSAKMRTPTWRRIKEYVKNGGTVYFTYDESTGALNAYFNELFGVEVQTPNNVDNYKSFRIVKDWVVLKAGSEISLMSKDNSEHLIVKAKTAEVIAEFADGVPALTVNEYGKGKAYLVTYPMDNYMFGVPYNSFKENGIFRLYDSVFEEAGMERMVKSSNYRIEIGLMSHLDDNEFLLICINHDNRETKAKLFFDKRCASKVNSIFDVFNKKYVQADNDQDSVSIDVDFEAAGVNVYKVVCKNI